MKTLREFLKELPLLNWIYLGSYKMKVYEALGQHTYLDGHICITLDLDTYNYTKTFNKSSGIWSITVYE